MSSPSSFRFRCPYCHTVLTVDAALMGTTGPCPKCEKPVQSPTLPSPPSTTATDPSSLETPPEVTEVTESSPSTAGENEEEKNIPKILPREVRKATFSDVTQATFKEPPAFKPERSGKHSIKERGPAEYRFPVAMLVRTLLPIFFTIAVFVLIYGIFKVIKKQNQGEPVKAGELAGRDLDAKPAGSLYPENARPGQKNKPTARLSSAPEAMELLQTFLKAKTLEERLPLIETTAAEGELAASILAGKFPEFRNVYVHSQKSFPLENVVDFFFGLEFINEDGSGNHQLMAVRSRSDMPPKVLADPILDLYGGRLKEFAAEPVNTTLGKTFFAVVSALPTCNDMRIPNRDKKLTLRLLPHEKSDEPVVVYASRLSGIGEMLQRGNYDLTYTKPAPCVILLGWNTDEKPDAPYLEAIDLKSTNWNP